MCSKYVDTPDVRYLPGDFPGATPRKAHVIEERGDRTLICLISYPSTGAIREVSASSVYTDFAAARRAY